MKRWHRVLLGMWLLSGGSYLFKNSHQSTELGAGIILLTGLCITIFSFWLFFGKIKKTVPSGTTSSSSARYRCLDCNKTLQESELKNDALLCPSCQGRIEQI